MAPLSIQADHAQRLALPLHLLYKFGCAWQRTVEHQYIDAEMEFPQQALTVRYGTRRKCLETGIVQGLAEPKGVSQVTIDQ
jgi:hypothetical protein